MAARNQPIEVTVDRIARPISLCSGKVSCSPPVKRRHREHLSRCEAVEISSARAREQVFEPVPVFASERYELLTVQLVTSHTAKIT